MKWINYEFKILFFIPDLSFSEGRSGNDPLTFGRIFGKNDFCVSVCVMCVLKCVFCVYVCVYGVILILRHPRRGGYPSDL